MVECGTNISKALVSLTAEIETLGSDAEGLCTRHLELVMSENKTKDWENKSTLYVQARIRGYGLTVNWYEIKWYGKKATGTRRMSKTLIKKPAKSYTYSMSVLERHAQPWEIDMVREIEEMLGRIRRRAIFISKAMAMLNRIEEGRADK